MASVDDVISFIEKNREDYDYLLDCDDNGDAGLSRSIIIFRENSIQQFRKYNSVLGFDSTFKKNNEKYPLFIVAGLNGENKVFIVCFALMHDCTERSFNGVMKAMRRKLTYPDGTPILFDVALSDEEDACINAIRSYYPECKTFRCDWHLEKNVIEKCNSFGQAKPYYAISQQVLEMFWDTKEAMTESEFNCKYKALEEYINSIGLGNPIVKSYIESEKKKENKANVEQLEPRLDEMKKKLFKYFINLFKKTHPRWADYHRHQVFHCGKFTTQFVESINGMLDKMGVNGKSSVGQMVTELFKFEQRQEFNTKFKSTHSNISRIRKNNLTNGTISLFGTFLSFIDTQLTSHGKDLQYVELHQSVDFKVLTWACQNNVYTANIEHVNDRKLYTTITVDNGSKYHCSRCEHSIGNGIVCRHYLCMIREGLSNTEVNSAFPIHALYVHDQWYLNGLCKEATNMKELIYPLVREHNIGAKVTFVEFNPLIERVQKSNQVLKDSAGSIIDEEEICTTTLDYDSSTDKRVTRTYAVYKPEFMKKMSDLYDHVIVSRKADINVLDTLSDKFVEAVVLHTTHIVAAATTNNFNRGFKGLAPSKAAAKSLKNAFHIDSKGTSSNNYRARIEQKVQKVTEQQRMTGDYSQQQGASDDEEEEVDEEEFEEVEEHAGESNRENIAPIVSLSQEQSQAIEVERSHSRYGLRTVLKSKIYDDPYKANIGWFGQSRKKARK